MTTTRGGGFRMLHLEGAMVPIQSDNLPSVALHRLYDATISHTSCNLFHPIQLYWQSNFVTRPSFPSIIIYAIGDNGPIDTRLVFCPTLCDTADLGSIILVILTTLVEPFLVPLPEVVVFL
jgi:hypothetical protein